MVNPVQNQGLCGCCYAFAATGALEGQYAKSTNKRVVLSAQQLTECDNGQNQFGCNGGMYDRSWNYVMKVGLATESSYPYTLASSTSVIL
jgi:C1A family cysteine protease